MYMDLFELIWSGNGKNVFLKEGFYLLLFFKMWDWILYKLSLSMDFEWKLFDMEFDSDLKMSDS